MKHFRRYLFGLILAAVAIICCASEKAAKAADRTTLDVSKNRIEITKDGTYQLTGKSDRYNVTVKSGVKAVLYMGGVNIHTSFYDETPPLLIESNAVVNIILKGKNELVNVEHGNAITLQKNAKVSFSKYSTGTLTVKGSGTGSGIGGTGFVYILGGTIHAEGGVFGAGLGNSLNPDTFSLYIRGGMTDAYGGVNTDRMDNWNYDTMYYDNQKVQDLIDHVYDISAKTFVITGGHLMTATSYTVPRNASGHELSPYYINIKSEKPAVITMDGASYGSNGIAGNGFLCLWGDCNGVQSIDVTYQNGSKDVIEPGIWGMYGTKIDKGKSVDLGAGDIILLEHGYIYQNQVFYTNEYRNLPIVTIAGNSTDHQIIVHAKNQQIVLDHLTAKLTKQGQAVIVAGSESNLVLILKGENKLQAINQNAGIKAGYQATVSIMADSDQDMLSFELSNQSAGFCTAYGKLTIYGGLVTADLNDQSVGIELGNEGTFVLGGGKLANIAADKRENDKQGKLINGDVKMKVMIHGGELEAKSIGTWEEANEEVMDCSSYIQTGGTVTISNRMVFGNIKIYGGKLTAHLAGSGSGSELYQFAGTVVLDRFVTDYSLGEDEDAEGFEYEYETGVLKGSAISNDNLYGGTLIETMKVEAEELKAISYGRC